MSYLHEQGVAHRDIKPDNIMISEQSNTLKLIDFNTAFDFTAQKGVTKAVDYTDCIRGGTGLKEWSAPETRHQQYYSAKCDSYSIGCILVYMLRYTSGSAFGNFTQSESSEEEEYDNEVNGQSTLTRWDNFRKSKSESGSEHVNSQLLYDLIESLLKIDPAQRMSPGQALAHKFNYETAMTPLVEYKMAALII